MKNEKNEVRARGGNTDAYCEYEGKTKHYSKDTWSNVNDGLMAIFAEFAACRDRGAAVPELHLYLAAVRQEVFEKVVFLDLLPAKRVNENEDFNRATHFVLFCF